MGFGLAFLLFPTEMASTLDIRLDDPTAIIEIRAFYGGLELGIAAYLFYSAFRPALVRPALLLITLMLGATSITRLLGVLSSPEPEPVIVELFLIEALGAIFAGALWKLDARLALKA